MSCSSHTQYDSKPRWTHMKRGHQPRETGHGRGRPKLAHRPARLGAMVDPLKLCKVMGRRPSMPCPGLRKKLFHIAMRSMRQSRNAHQLPCSSSFTLRANDYVKGPGHASQATSCLQTALLQQQGIVANILTFCSSPGGCSNG